MSSEFGMFKATLLPRKECASKARLCTNRQQRSAEARITKNTPFFWAHYFQAKVGRVCLLEY